MSADQPMPAAVAKKLLVYKQTLTAQKWETLKNAYHRASASYEPRLALKVAEHATFRVPSNRPPA